MSEQESQHPTHSKRRRTARTEAEEENAPKQRIAATQPVPRSEALSHSQTSEQTFGVRWGEIPSVERQAELVRRLQVWEQEGDHGDRPGPFAHDMRNEVG